MASQSSTEPETVRYALQLADISAREDIPVQGRWQQVANTARTLADRLRVRHGEIDEHSALGATPLPRTLTALVTEALAAPGPTDDAVLTAIYELLRTSANLCMDHDANRKLLLDASFPHTVISLLQRYSAMEVQNAMLTAVSLLELQVLKVSAGVLLNMSLHYEPIRRYLLSVNAPDLLIHLRSIIFPPCMWSKNSAAVKPVSALKEEWTWRSGFSSWSSLALNELLRDHDAFRILQTTTVRHLVDILRGFTTPYQVSDIITHEPTMRNSLCTTEEELLVDSCSLLESLALDSEDVQKFIGQTVTETDPEGNPGPLLKILTQFIELGEHPPYWSMEAPSEREKHVKSFDMCKAAVIRTLVEVSGCLSCMDTLWDLSRPSGWFVPSMLRWVKLDPKDQKNDLMLICATLSLANLVRRESHCTALVQAPVSIVSDLVPLLDVKTDIKVRHGTLGLLKHLAQTNTTQSALSEANVIEKLIETEAWGEKLDMAEPVQLLAIGTAKHLCTNSVESAIVLTTTQVDSSDSHSLTGAQQILGLIQRSDTVAVKSEGTRALFQVIRSLSSQQPKSTTQPERQEAALEAMTHPAVVKVLVELAHQGRFKPYFVLIMEGVLGLTFLSLRDNGAPLVAEGLLAALPSQTAQIAESSSQSTSQSSQTSPSSAPANLLELLLDILIHETYGEELIPVELRVNTCSLLGSVGRKNVENKDREYIRLKCYDPLQSLATNAVDARLKDAAQKAVDLYLT